MTTPGGFAILLTMSDDFSSLPTGLWVSAHIRRCSNAGIPVYVAHKGGAERGTVTLRISVSGKGNRILTQARDMDGVLGWMDPFDGRLVDEAEASGYIRQAVDSDPDLWVLEIEDKEGKNPFEGKIL